MLKCHFQMVSNTWFWMFYVHLTSVFVCARWHGALVHANWALYSGENGSKTNVLSWPHYITHMVGWLAIWHGGVQLNMFIQFFSPFLPICMKRSIQSHFKQNMKWIEMAVSYSIVCTQTTSPILALQSILRLSAHWKIGFWYKNIIFCRLPFAYLVPKSAIQYCILRNGTFSVSTNWGSPLYLE